MTIEQYKEFREDFTSIVWYKGQVTEKRKYITTLYCWDKEGSHADAIKKATEDHAATKAILKEKLSKYGIDYESMRAHSKALSALMSRAKRNQQSIDKYKIAPLKLRETKERIEKEIANYKIGNK